MVRRCSNGKDFKVIIMSYWIDAPHQYPQGKTHGKLIWSKDRFSVHGQDHRFSIYLDDYYLGELVNGFGTLNKKFKGKFENWIEFLRNKDLNKVEHTRDLAKEALQTCDFIEKLWSDV